MTPVWPGLHEFGAPELRKLLKISILWMVQLPRIEACYGLSAFDERSACQGTQGVGDTVGPGPEGWRPRRLRPSLVAPERAHCRRFRALSQPGCQRSADFVTGPDSRTRPAPLRNAPKRGFTAETGRSKEGRDEEKPSIRGGSRLPTVPTRALSQREAARSVPWHS